jgi:1-deoxy-D-xylulose-5-phosphate synthase
VVHVLTQKGRGYAPAEEDDIQRLHDFKVVASAGDAAGGLPGAGREVVPIGTALVNGSSGTPAEAAELPVTTYTDAFTRSLLRQAEVDPRIVAITAAMPGPTGLLPFEARFPDRFVDVGIAEQHAVTAAAGMAMAGMRPVVAVYSTFFSRAFDQANLDVGLHRLPVVLVLDRAGITGDDGPSHHGVLDMALGLSIPGMTVFAPSNAPEVEVMLAQALTLDGPSMIRFPKTPAPWADPEAVGSGFEARQVRAGDGSVCLLAVGKMVAAAEEAAALLLPEGIDLTVWDVRVVSDPDPVMVADAGRHGLVVTAEDGVRQGGAGMFLADAVRASCARGSAPPVVSLGIPRTYLAQGKPDRILARLGLDGPGLARSVRDALGIEDETHGGVPSVATPPRAVAPARPASARSSEPRD